MAEPAPRSPEYAAIQASLQRGWGNWNTSTVTSQVLLPEGLEIRLGIKKVSSENSDAFLDTALIGRRGDHDERVFPGTKSYDGTYSDLRLRWRGIELEVETARLNDDLLMLVRPLARAGEREFTGHRRVFGGHAVEPTGISFARTRCNPRPRGRRREIRIFAAGNVSDDPHVQVANPHFTISLSGPAGLSTGRPRDINEIVRLVNAAKQRLTDRTAPADSPAMLKSALESVIAWDTIYEPAGRRIVTPVSRIWNENWGGYVLFEWDTFFAATLAAMANRDLAYANIIEVLNETTPEGMSPNYARAGGWKSSDRSEPPVGSLTVLSMYRRFHDRWLLESTYDRLLNWNAWWPANRAVGHYLVWGSDPSAQAGRSG